MGNVYWRIIEMGLLLWRGCLGTEGQTVGRPVSQELIAGEVFLRPLSAFHTSHLLLFFYFTLAGTSDVVWKKSTILKYQSNKRIRSRNLIIPL